MFKPKRKRSTLLFWRRFYSNTKYGKSINYVYGLTPRGCNSTNSRINKTNIRRTLWGYFNTPANVMFVTANIFAFTGVVTYNTLTQISNTQKMMSDEQFLLCQMGVGNGAIRYGDESTNEIVDNNNNNITINERVSREYNYEPVPKGLFRNIKNKIISPENSKVLSEDLEEDLQATKTEELVNPNITVQEKIIHGEAAENNVDIPYITYMSKGFPLEKNKSINSINSVIAKKSLFQLLYMYNLYEEVIKESSLNVNERDTRDSSMRSPTNRSPWNNEIIKLRNENSELISKTQGMHTPIFTFYQVWKENHENGFLNLETLYRNPILPKWNKYPSSLKALCQLIYDNNFKDINDIDKIYSKIRQPKLQKLVRFWLFDHLYLLKSVNMLESGNNNIIFKNEQFYSKLINDSYRDKDPILFLKYSSIVLGTKNDTSNDKNTKIFFNWNSSYKQRVIHIDTLLNILQGYIGIKQRHPRNHYDTEILKVIQLIKNNGVIINDKSKQRDQNALSNVYILLPDRDGATDSLKRLVNEKQSQKYYETLSQDRRFTDMLKTVKDLMHS